MATDPSKKKNAMIELIEQKEDGIQETENVLARLWRIILFQYGLSGNSWTRQITKYQDRISALSSRKGISNMKGNLTRRLAEDKLTWTSLERGLAILEFDHIRIELHLTRKGRTRVIGLDVENDELSIDDDDDD